MNRLKNSDNQHDLFDVAGSKFFFDLDNLSKFIRIEKSDTIEDILSQSSEETTDTESSESDSDEEDMGMYTQIIDITKWEITKMMIDTVLTEQTPIDEAMGYQRLSGQLSIPFKLSFNTLLKYEIIKEDDGR